MTVAPFKNRTHAGQLLAGRLTKYADDKRVLVLALPRGGVPVAYEVARRLRAPLDVIIVRKLGVPGREEFAMGAIASGGVQVINEAVVGALVISPAAIGQTIAEERAELQRREHAYRGSQPPFSATGKTVILVDDGIATGATVAAAVKLLRKQNPGRLVIAVPTASADAAAALEPMVDEFVSLLIPQDFHAVGLYYEDFQQTTDQEVNDLLGRAREWAAASAASDASTV